VRATGDRVVVRAPAKINLALRVGALDDDGYHDVVSVYQAVSLFEEVSATPGEPGAGLTVAVRGTGADGVPTDGTNLAVRAAHALAQRAGVVPQAHLAIRKTAPVAGGMAGGSADAAAALVACDLLWGTGLGREELLELGAELGSDVPFALLGGTALGTRRGDQVTSLLARGEYHWVLALADTGLSTPAVYAECDRLRAERGEDVPDVEPQVPAPLSQALRTGDAAGLGAALSNDLQEAACSLRPGLQRVLDLGADHGALGSVVSGSGPTVALLVADSSAALELAVALTASGVASDVRRVTGPVPGARQVEPVATSPHHPSHLSR
jgi:4-diphosphocytidyl-2-C-methyl-D-erythritol kinase